MPSLTIRPDNILARMAEGILADEIWKAAATKDPAPLPTQETRVNNSTGPAMLGTARPMAKHEAVVGMG